MLSTGVQEPHGWVSGVLGLGEMVNQESILIRIAAGNLAKEFLTLLSPCPRSLRAHKIPLYAQISPGSPDCRAASNN